MSLKDAGINSQWGDNEYSIIGTDYASHGKLDEQGQIPTVSGLDSLHQWISRRLKTYLGMYYFIDPNYGSTLKDYVGEINNEHTRTLVCLIIQTCTLEHELIKEAYVTYNPRKSGYDLRVVLDEDVLGIKDEIELFFTEELII